MVSVVVQSPKGGRERYRFRSFQPLLSLKPAPGSMIIVPAILESQQEQMDLLVKISDNRRIKVKNFYTSLQHVVTTSLRHDRGFIPQMTIKSIHQDSISKESHSPKLSSVYPDGETGGTGEKNNSVQPEQQEPSFQAESLTKQSIQTPPPIQQSFKGDPLQTPKLCHDLKNVTKQDLKQSPALKTSMLSNHGLHHAGKDHSIKDHSIKDHSIKNHFVHDKLVHDKFVHNHLPKQNNVQIDVNKENAKYLKTDSLSINMLNKIHLYIPAEEGLLAETGYVVNQINKKPLNNQPMHFSVGKSWNMHIDKHANLTLSPNMDVPKESLKTEKILLKFFLCHAHKPNQTAYKTINLKIVLNDALALLNTNHAPSHDKKEPVDLLIIATDKMLKTSTSSLDTFSLGVPSLDTSQLTTTSSSKSTSMEFDSKHKVQDMLDQDILDNKAFPTYAANMLQSSQPAFTSISESQEALPVSSETLDHDQDGEKNAHKSQEVKGFKKNTSIPVDDKNKQDGEHQNNEENDHEDKPVISKTSISKENTPRTNTPREKLDTLTTQQPINHTVQQNTVQQKQSPIFLKQLGEFKVPRFVFYIKLPLLLSLPMQQQQQDIDDGILPTESSVSEKQLTAEQFTVKEQPVIAEPVVGKPVVAEHVVTSIEPSSADEKILNKQIKLESTSEEQQSVEQSNVEKTTIQESSVEQSKEENMDNWILPTVSSASEKQPPLEQHTLEQPTLEQHTLEQQSVDEPVVEQPVVGEPTVEQSVEQPVIEESTIKEQPVEQPVAEQSEVEQPVVKEELVVEKSVVTEPVVTSIESSSSDKKILNKQIKLESTSEEQPEVEQSAVKQPVVEQPVVDEPTVEQFVEQPVAEQSEVEQPVVKESVIKEELVVEKSVVAEPVVTSIEQINQTESTDDRKKYKKHRIDATSVTDVEDHSLQPQDHKFQENETISKKVNEENNDQKDNNNQEVENNSSEDNKQKNYEIPQNTKIAEHKNQDRTETNNADHHFSSKPSDVISLKKFHNRIEILKNAIQGTKSSASSLKSVGLVGSVEESLSTKQETVLTQPESTSEEQPPLEQHTLEQSPVKQQSEVEQPVVEQPTVEQPVIEESTIKEQPVEQPVAEQFEVEQPVVKEELVVEKSVVTEPVVTSIEPSSADKKTDVLLNNHHSQQDSSPLSSLKDKMSPKTEVQENIKNDEHDNNQSKQHLKSGFSTQKIKARSLLDAVQRYLRKNAVQSVSKASDSNKNALQDTSQDVPRTDVQQVANESNELAQDSIASESLLKKEETLQSTQSIQSTELTESMPAKEDSSTEATDVQEEKHDMHTESVHAEDVSSKDVPSKDTQLSQKISKNEPVSNVTTEKDITPPLTPPSLHSNLENLTQNNLTTTKPSTMEPTSLESPPLEPSMMEPTSLIEKLTDQDDAAYDPFSTIVMDPKLRQHFVKKKENVYALSLPKTRVTVSLEPHLQNIQFSYTTVMDKKEVLVTSNESKNFFSILVPNNVLVYTDGIKLYIYSAYAMEEDIVIGYNTRVCSYHKDHQQGVFIPKHHFPITQYPNIPYLLLRLALLKGADYVDIANVEVHVLCFSFTDAATVEKYYIYGSNPLLEKIVSLIHDLKQEHYRGIKVA